MKIWTHPAIVEAPDRRSCVDLTDHLMRAIKDSGTSDGFVIAFCRHTTCSLLINEWESGLQVDIVRRVRELIPDDFYYAHDDFAIRTENLVKDERVNGPAHVAQMVLGGTSQMIPVVGGEPALGDWQRLFLLELDEPKPRDVSFHVVA